MTRPPPLLPQTEFKLGRVRRPGLQLHSPHAVQVRACRLAAVHATPRAHPAASPSAAGGLQPRGLLQPPALIRTAALLPTMHLQCYQSPEPHWPWARGLSLPNRAILNEPRCQLRRQPVLHAAARGRSSVGCTASRRLRALLHCPGQGCSGGASSLQPCVPCRPCPRSRVPQLALNASANGLEGLGFCVQTPQGGTKGIFSYLQASPDLAHCGFIGLHVFSALLCPVAACLVACLSLQMQVRTRTTTLSCMPVVPGSGRGTDDEAD